MSTRPTGLYAARRFGTDETHDVQPSLTVQETGWMVGQVVVSSYLNWLFRGLGELGQYLLDHQYSSAINTPVQIDVDASDGTFTRASGSWLADGFVAGQSISAGGFTNAGNNVGATAGATKIIDTVNATVITVTDNAGLVDETGSGNEEIVAWMEFDGPVAQGKTRIHDTGSALDPLALDVDGDTSIDGDLTVTTIAGLGGALQIKSGVRLFAIVSPTTLVATANNYNPTGLATANVLRISSSVAGSNITGLAAQEDGRVITILNVGAETIELVTASGSSSAANQFKIRGGNISLATDQTAILFYDGTSQRWRPLSWMAEVGGTSW